MPLSISKHLGVTREKFARTGAFDAVLDVDTRLFIDPHLLQYTAAPELAGSYNTLRKRFADILILLSNSNKAGDAFWRQADRIFTFPEFAGLCIGYSAKGIQGAGMGKHFRHQLLTTAKVIVDAGINDPEIFELMGLFEEGVGADRISDMIGRVIIRDLLIYTENVLSRLGVDGSPYTHNDSTFQVVKNPFTNTDVVLLPLDILRDLPIAKSWDEIDDVVAQNVALRNRLNKEIEGTWRSAARLNKYVLKSVVLKRPKILKSLIKAYRAARPRQYDFGSDPAGEVIWLPVAQDCVDRFPLTLTLSESPVARDVLDVVLAICNKFKDLIEHNGLWSLLYEPNKKPKHESASQKLFYGIADSYCEANDLDLSPEVNSGRGPVDFKVSKGYAHRVVAEAKLTTNARWIHGLGSQLEEYQKAEKTDRAVYLLIDVEGAPANRNQAVRDLVSKRKRNGLRVPAVVYIDARPRESASRYKPPRALGYR